MTKCDIYFNFIKYLKKKPYYSPFVRVTKELQSILCPSPLLLLQTLKMATSVAANSMLRTGKGRSYSKLRPLKRTGT